jgi:flavin reductase (DIM6/NTAB) family NADH-FMN oxidoreductase RutF
MHMTQKPAEYSEAAVRKFPEQVVIAVARDNNGICNPITLGWTMITSHKPPMMALSVGFSRYSCEVIRQAGEFVIAFPSQHMAEDVLSFGTISGRDANKLEECGTNVLPAEKIDCVLLSNAVANFECRLTAELETGDHALFAGEVVRSWAHTGKPKRLYTIGSGYSMGTVIPEEVMKYSPGMFGNKGKQ